MTENATLQKKLNTQNHSFISNSGAGISPSLELLKANYERDEHKWNAEKLTLNAKVMELEQAIKTKDEEATRREKRLEKNLQTEMQMQADAYEEQFDSMQNENHKIKNQNMFLETHMHEQRLEQERQNRLLSSTFYHLGQI